MDGPAEDKPEEEQQAGLSQTSPEKTRGIRRRKGPRRVSCLALMVVLVGLAAAGALLWRLNRPRPLSFVSKGVGSRHIAFVVLYPPDWKAERVGFTTAPESPSAPDYEFVRLHHRKLTGANKWIEEHMFQARDQDWAQTNIDIRLMRLKGTGRTIDTEEQMFRRMILPQLTRTGGTFRLERRSHPLGPGLELTVTLSAKLRRGGPGDYRTLLLYPPVPPGQEPVELAISYITDEKVKPRIQAVFADVVSHLKLVEGK